ncbi:GGDEF domain-containing protein [Vibrio cincinnatiensis]|nr:GGDEF domain-containing protein [Vibrio cincinnatiensis]MCG3736872.1 GGDEF domain-containing protein [Vibrio cincinnatiensis]MCG3743783.1 GGDEF domain-containing protein [Vibrio cincinnatiensis]MCG3748006.1 GGDEF domain-containing protein [Vibrio cincinnatiensis]MCG3758878.1 GGDEF domain-containing protein [Vibrio cincinnatiensis]
MLKSTSLATEEQHHHLDAQIKHSRDILLRIPGIPVKIKRDLRELFTQPSAQSQSKTAQAVHLLGLYERAIKILTHNSPSSHNEQPSSAENLLLTQLSSELQNLITELDFEGESGDLLADIRTKLLLGVNTQTLLELALQVLKLVIDGTQYERKSSEKFLEQVNASLMKNLKSTGQNLQQSIQYQTHRQEMNQEFRQLVARGHHELKKGEVAAETLDTVFNDMTSLSERFELAQQREQALIERMHYTKNQVEALFELTQDYRRRLEDQAQRMLQDPLTKVYNRTAFNDHLELEYRRWIRSQHPLRLVVLDIDKFKAINESFGYLAGDKALKIIARTIHKELNKTDTLARFSGEEFILLLPERSDSECHQLVQQIQRNIARLPFKFRDKHITITLSGSTTAFKESDTPEIVLDRLYRSLQEVKKYGPNQLAWK